MTDDRTGARFDVRSLSLTRHLGQGLLFAGILVDKPDPMLFLTASMAEGDVDARLYEERGTATLGVETRRFTLGTPDANARTHADLVTLFSGLPDQTPVLASSTLLPLVGTLFRAEARRLRIVVLAHRPSHRDPRFAAIAASELLSVDRSTLPYARRVIVPSLHTAMSLGAAGVLPDQLAVVLPGADKAPLAEMTGEAPTFLAPAPLVPSAGHDVLLEALASLSARQWKLVCAAPEGEASWGTHLREMAHRLGIAERVTWAVPAGPGDLKAAYHSARLVVLAARYDAHGTAVLEALARGVPVCTTNAGAAGGVLPANAGMLVPPESARELAHVLGALLDTPQLMEHLTQGALKARDELRSWSRVGAEMKRELEVACR